MECFTTDFFQFFTEKRQNLAFGWTAGYLPSNPSFSEIFVKFISEDPKSYVAWQLVKQHVDSLSGDNNLFPFHLWRREIVLKSEKVSKCFVQDCSMKYLTRV